MMRKIAIHRNVLVMKCQNISDVGLQPGIQTVILRTIFFRPDNFTQQLFRLVVSVQEASFAAFFVVNDKVECHLGSLGPLEIGRLGPVSYEIASAVFGFGIIFVVRLDPSFGHVFDRHNEAFGAAAETLLIAHFVAYWGANGRAHEKGDASRDFPLSSVVDEKRLLYLLDEVPIILQTNEVRWHRSVICERPRFRSVTVLLYPYF